MTSHSTDDQNLHLPSDLNCLKGLKIVHLNVCSLVNKIDEIRQSLIGSSSIDFFVQLKHGLSHTTIVIYSRLITLCYTDLIALGSAFLAPSYMEGA